MKNDYLYWRGFHDIILKGWKELDGEDLANARMRFLAKSDFYKHMYNGLYKVLVRDRQLTPFTEQPAEYRVELVDISAEHLLEASINEQGYFIQALMAFLWLLNN